MRIFDFRQRLFESEPYDGSSEYLYHGTNIWSLALIITTDRLEEGAYWGKPGEPHGPRFSESSEVAYTFIEYASPDWPIGGVLALDTWGLMQDYKMVTYQDKPYGSDIPFGEEREVVPLTETIAPLSKYLTGIRVEDEHIQEGMSDEGIEFAIGEKGYEVSPDTMRQAVAGLAKHPLRT